MNHFDLLKAKLTETRDLAGIHSVLNWDQEVMMPPGGAMRRARQSATLAGLYHAKITTEVPPLLAEVEAHEFADMSPTDQANIREIRRQVDRLVKLPEAHVVETSRVVSEAQQAWIKAKKENDFPQFAPVLERIFDLRIQEAEYIGYEENPYDALMDDYEPGMKASVLVPLFENIVSELKPILSKIAAAPQVKDDFLKAHVGSKAQLAWSENVLKSLGYDFNRGRQDLSAHPFTINFGSEDVRITTVVNEKDIQAMLFSSIHECGHALYEQGLPPEHYGLPASVHCSLSIHESQSRLYENNVARDLPFWQHFHPSLAALYPDGLKGKTPEDIFQAVNRVEPSLIRIYSDELHYHMHIALRFGIENDLVNRRIKVKDLPELWNARIKETLGLDVPSDAQGVLQDIHWAHGSVGYFPTYSLGSFFAAQFMHQAHQDRPTLKNELAQGQFGPLLDWLREKIHHHGRLYTSNELCKRITGEALNVSYFVDYAKEKFGRVYGIDLD